MSTTTDAVGEPPILWYVAEDQSHNPYPSHAETLGTAQQHGYDLITVPITNAQYENRVFKQVPTWLEAYTQGGSLSDALLDPLSPTDTDLAPGDANTGIIGKISPWIDLTSRDPLIAQISQQVFKLELAYAAFCGLQNVIIHGPTSGDVAQYARTIREGLAVGPYISLHVLLPMKAELEHDYGLERRLDELANVHDDAEQTDFSVWTTWHRLRTICSYSPRLGIALEVPRQLPSQSIQDHWYAEPVRMLVLPRTTFLRNAKGYPVLHKLHQQFLTRLMRLRVCPWLLLTDVTESSEQDPTPSQAAQKPKDSHLKYIRHLQQTQPERTPIERFGHGYQDFIQSPLQPLSDNLESITYEVFEKDPVKYDWYEHATELALRDLYAVHGRPLIVAVAGSGRGPLMSKALLAAKTVNVPVRCWAVEKNPNAYVHLQRRNATDPLWNGQVTVVKSDMRAWKGPLIDGQVGKVDILISELLGSFADNELSPECLDGVQHVLAEHGVSIPQSYSAHFTPIASPRLHNDLLTRPGQDKWEIPVVVMLQQFSFISLQPDGTPDIVEAWSYSHPLPNDILDKARLRAGGSADGGPGGLDGGDGSNEHNSRHCKSTFTCKDEAVCHGLAGYFETVLYASSRGEKVELSTNPLTMPEKSKDMISWFPIFFPIKTPLYIPAGSDVEVSIWRATDDRKVWYEWSLEVHNSGLIALSDLHSSRKNGCLM